MLSSIFIQAFGGKAGSENAIQSGLGSLVTSYIFSMPAIQYSVSSLATSSKVQW